MEVKTMKKEKQIETLKREIALFEGWSESEINTMGHVSGRTSRAIITRKKRLSKLQQP